MDPILEFNGYDFGTAIFLMKKEGKRVTRRGWNGANQWLAINPGSIVSVSPNRPLAEVFPIGTEVEIRPYIIIKTVQGSIVPWVASQTDILAEDWMVAE